MLRCEVRRDGDRYLAVNLETCLVAVGATPGQARRKLGDAMAGYFASEAEVLAAGEIHARVRVRWYLLRCILFGLRRWFARHDFTARLSRGEIGYVIAECPELPGCVSQGRTPSEALANIGEAIVLWEESNAWSA